MTASATRLSAFVALAFAITLGVLWLSSRDDATAPLTHHIAVAPAAQHGRHATTRVVGTRESAQQVADSAIEGTRGPGGRRPDLTPLPASAFTRPIARYRVYAVGRAHVLARQAGALTSALRTGDRAAARRDWLTVYGTYMRIGAAYGALGDLDAAIDGRGRGLHRIEHGLWTGGRLAALVPVSRRVQAEVAQVPHALRTGPLDPLDYATRAHEILEDAQRDQLSGGLARWSGAGVLATAADLDATHVVLRTLQPVLAGRGDVLAQVQSRLITLGATLRAIRRAHGGWPALGRLSRAEHERLTGGLGASLEALAGVPGALETALPPVIPSLKDAGR